MKDDEERLAMRQGDMPPPVPERVANPRVREDGAVQDFKGTWERGTVPPTKTPAQEHGLIIVEASSHSP